MLEFGLEGPMTGGVTWDKASGPKSKWKPPDDANSVVQLVVEVVAKGTAEAAEKEGGSTAEEETTDEPPPAAAMTEAMALRVEEWNHHRSVLLDSW
jgi:hypothetical protein